MDAEPSNPPLAESRSQRLARAALGLFVFILGVWTLRDFLPAIVWAAIFAIAIWPLYRRARRRWPPGKHNVLLPSLFTLMIALVFIVPLAITAVQLGQEASSVVQWLQQAYRSGVPAPGFLGHLPFGSQQATTWWNNNLADPGAASDLLRRLGRGEVVSYSRRLGSQLVHRLVLFGFTLLTLFFLFRDGEHLAMQMRRASARAFGPPGERVGRQVVASVHGTVDGLVLVGLAEGVLLGIAFVVAGVPHPTLLGALTAVGAMIPFGACVVPGVAALILLAQGSAAMGIGVFAFALVVAFIADHFVRPVLIGGATRLPFLWVLFGILGGVETWGLLGLFLGPAIMAVLVLLWRELAGEPA